MSNQSFYELVRIVVPIIKKEDTKFSESIGVEERILITLRYFANGSNFRTPFSFMRGGSTIGKIVAITSETLWNYFNEEYAKLPAEFEWINISDLFYQLWNLSHYPDIVVDKAIQIQKLSNAGSIVLMPYCETDECFTIIESDNSDDEILQPSRVGRCLHLNGNDVNVPNSTPLLYNEIDKRFPFYIVPNEAFPLSSYLIKPNPHRKLNDTKRTSRVRKTVECSIIMICRKFQVLMVPSVYKNEHTLTNIIRSVYVLYNFVRKKKVELYKAAYEENSVSALPNMQQQYDEFSNKTSYGSLSHYIAHYFTRPQASLPWQWKYCITDN